MSQEITLARPYARAAFAIARDRGDLAGWSKALAFSARVAADPRVAPLLGDPSLADADAVELLAVEGADAGGNGPSHGRYAPASYNRASMQDGTKRHEYACHAPARVHA